MNWPNGSNVVVTLVGLTDHVTNSVVTNATVTTRLQLLSGSATLYPNGGVDVQGVAWPVILASIGGGSYQATTPSTSVLTPGRAYQLYTVATDGTTTVSWVDNVTVV